MKKAIIVDIDNTLTNSSYLTEFIPKNQYKRKLG